ncbi:FAD-binding oxidoreductase [Polymorphobacter arshaanensis]|uniref:FAD-binding oxidoreductase n=1 Tax=Glacieibacterium arshaanense TaxID=2511025 RepID=A0A4Y9EN27_9SPHN|nr:FAD-binding oxidoreductase [Polymorphobacter arshaanensis]TFU03181.1 FAD-binding oxidoreductase [Polymorphobacter arshaanensis]
MNIQLGGWGRYPRASCAVTTPDTPDAVSATLAALPDSIARGNGRAYGDSALNPDGVISSARLSHLLSFDDATGTLTCEAGVLLGDITDALLPRGWFAPVTPGTRFVTVGGMVASDVHGKNHHGAGSFGDHLDWVDLVLPDGRTLRASRDSEPELFAATCGGMGLTGVIVRAAFRLQRVETSRIRQRTLRAPDLAAALEIFEASAASTYSVAWIDGLAGGARLGRSVVHLGEHARLDELPAADRATPFARAARRPLTVPIDFPGFALSWPTVKAFNELAYHLPATGDRMVDLDPYFYPLDAVFGWNRIYGARGFVQYQCVLPVAESPLGLRRLLEAIAAGGGASFLAVLKRMGPASFGMLSFPMEGYTLAMDFPATPANLALLARLDAITAEHGGRIYLTKDACTTPAAVARGYPRLEAFREVRRRYGLAGRIESLQSRRLEL